MTDEVAVEAKGRQAPLAGSWKTGETRDYVVVAVVAGVASDLSADAVVVATGLR